MFVTVFAGILDLDSGEISLQRRRPRTAFPVLRHEWPLQTMLEKKKGGLVLGFVADSVYRNDVIRLQPGEGLVIYTDGVTEAMNGEHELFKEDTPGQRWPRYPPPALRARSSTGDRAPCGLSSAPPAER
jgi:sigma-B regulation protein RsbU (phosphoserine phosphatase)